MAAPPTGGLGSGMYRSWVRQTLAPDELRGRETELAELTAFCIADEGPAYAWWQAPPWAGKTALMSWFALHPPAGAKVVAFFVTGRVAAMNNRYSFTDVVGAQLADLAGTQPAPPFSESVRDIAFLDLLTAAVEQCRSIGERLVLLVDGLDEDHSRWPEGGHSIAGMLPARPPDGLRVIVSGRPLPLPADVMDEHPLRDPAVVRPLGGSAHGRTIRADAERDIRRLLNGTRTERRLLGLMTVAGGGLSRSDLTELAGARPAEIDACMGTVGGRAFTRRGDTGSYLIAHDQLREMSESLLGDRLLNKHRNRLSRWNDLYRDRSWPEGTPGYLLQDYFQLVAADGDLAGTVSLAVDQRRQDRIRQMYGSDTLALNQIATAQRVVAASEFPPLGLMADLALSRLRIVTRNAEIPVELAATMVRLGHPDHAEVAVRSAPLRSRAKTAAHLVRALAEAGYLAEGEKIAELITDDELRAAAWVDLTRGAVTGGELPEELVRRTVGAVENVIYNVKRAKLHLLLADSIACSGRGDEAIRHADVARHLIKTAPHMDPIPGTWDPAVHQFMMDEEAAAMAHAARIDVMVRGGPAGRNETARRLAEDLRHPSDRAPALLDLALWAESQGHDVSDLLERVMDDTAEIVTWDSRTDFYHKLRKHWSHHRRDDRRRREVLHVAEQQVRAIGWKPDRVVPLARLAFLWNTLAEPETAERLLAESEQLAGSTGMLASLAEELARAGDNSRAANLAGLVQSSIDGFAEAANWSEQLRRVLIRSLARSGDFPRAEALFESVERLSERGALAMDIATAAADAGDPHRAEALFRAAVEGGHAGWVADATVQLIDALVRAGDLDRAESLAAEFRGRSARSLTIDVVAAEAAAGEVARARRLASRFRSARKRRTSELMIAMALARGGEFDEALAIVRTDTDERHRDELLARLIALAAAGGDPNFGEAVVAEINEPGYRLMALVSMACARSSTRELRDFRRLVKLIRHLPVTGRPPAPHAYRALALAAAECGEWDLAVSLTELRAFWYPSSTMLEFAEPVGTAMRPEQVVARIAALVGAAGDLVTAAALDALLDRRLDNPDPGVRASIMISLLALRPDLFDDCLAAVHAIPHSEARTRFYTRLAVGFADAGPRDRMFALALAEEDWLEAVPDLARFRPEMVAAIADAVLS
ncbi:hypothetical protein AB0M02_41700 [Actinoplanes sp. NPDC051861]|uniref:hypothetical protein n=1 Tax=Actinoplanes sp. NPDC051861 TaxID=3155170 RepID=UPI0034149C0D